MARLMGYKQIIENMDFDIKNMKLLGMNEFIFGLPEEKTSEILCPLFGYTKDGENKARIKVDIRRGTENMTVDIHPTDGRNARRLNAADLDEKQLTAISSIIRQCLIERETRNRLAASNPRLKDILPVIEEWAKKCTVNYGNGYTARLDFGRKASENVSKPYHAIVIERNGMQMGTIPLRQNSDGEITHNIQIPFFGQADKDIPLPMKDSLMLVRKAISSIVGENISVPSMPERLKLEKNVLDKKNRELEELMTVNVQTRKYNSWLPMSELNRDEFQKYRLEFEHYFHAPDKAEITLVARCVDGKNNDCEDIAHGQINPQDPLKRIVLKALTDDCREMLQTLCQNGRVKDAGQYTERYQDYPDDEIECFNWSKIDVTDLYRKYIQLRNAQYLFSPLTDIQIVRKCGENDWTEKDWLVAKLAGISDIAEKMRVAYDTKHLRNAAQVPLYGFILQEEAHKAFAPEVNRLKEAMNRMDNVQIRKDRTNGYVNALHLSCHIDGERQMSLSIGNELVDRCNRTQDPELARQQIAAIFYSREFS